MAEFIKNATAEDQELIRAVRVSRADFRCELASAPGMVLDREEMLALEEKLRRSELIHAPGLRP